MPRERSPNRDKAYEIYKEHNGDIKLKDIAAQLNLKDTQIRKWKSQDKWEQKLKGTLPKVKSNITKTKGNDVPIEVSWIDIENEYVTDIRKKPCTLENLSEKYNISISTIEKYSMDNSWSDKRKKYKENMKQKVQEKTADIISDKIANYKAKHLKISDKILDQIAKALSNEDELYTYVEKLRQGFAPGEFEESIVTERLNSINDSKVVNLTNALDKIQKMQRQTLGILDAKDIKEEKVVEEENKHFDLPVRLIAPVYADMDFDIEDKNHKEYILDGGRGSTKSSVISLEGIKLLINNPDMHWLALRKVSNTLKDSVFNQIRWAISALELDDKFHCTTSPLEITYKPTGQKIYFRGADDPLKIKSIKPPFGYIGILWFEELDQFAGAEEIRNIEQSAIRGGNDAYVFKSFNPPKTKNNWANRYVTIPKESQYHLHTTYKDVPKKWLGKAFLDEAEYLKEINPTAYEHEYKGIANGNGGNVFDNVEIREITNEEIEHFDRIYNGVDWGWFPDPWAFNRMYFNAAKRELYIFDEAHANKKSNRETADILINEHGIKPNDKLTCDSAENKSIGDYKSYGLFARGAIKGPGSVDYSMKWLQSLTKIIIDRTRCPKTCDEFLDYEYERDKEGNVISGYPDKDNHHIDAVRYAMNDVWRRRGR